VESVNASVCRWLAVGLAAFVLASACGGDAERPVTLFVVDQNILHGIGDEDPGVEAYDRLPERIELIAAALAELQPDVVFLQEVVVPAAGDAYPDVRALLLDALGEEYTAVFGDITGAPVGQGSLGQLTITRLPVLSSENHFVGGARSVQRVTVETPAGPVDLYNAHLEGAGAVLDVGPDAPVEEIEDVLAFIERTRSGPVVLAGDFNAQPDDPSVRALLAAGFVDAMAAAGDAACDRAGGSGCTNSTVPLGDNPQRLASRRIDYVFLLPAEDLAIEAAAAQLFLGEPQETARGLLWASDHIGLQVRLELR
jgi:endonuclease/exonuclease/phosphatase family metal-dependent hydrolase